MGRARAPRDEMAVDPTAPIPGRPAALEPSEPLGASAVEGEGGVGPYKLALRRLRRNKTALAFGAIFLVIVVMCLLRAALREARRAHDARPPTTSPTRSRCGGKTKDVVSPGGIPIGPTWPGQVLPRRRLERPRRRGPAALRRPQLARDRLHRDLHQLLLRDDHRPRSRATTGASSTACSSRTMDLIWAYPVILLGDRARHRAGGRRPRLRPVHRQGALATGSRRSSSASSTSRTWRSRCAARC